MRPQGIERSPLASGDSNSGLECTSDCGLCSLGSTCLDDGDCNSDICNLGFCAGAGSLGVGTPCNDDRACRSGSCAGVCVEVCGDGFCDGLEKCGDANAGFECSTDCGLCGNGDFCTSDEDCSSNACGLAIPPTCIPFQSVGPLGPCSSDNDCQSGSCTLGLCDTVCGDGICSAGEICGAGNSGANCNADCGLCPNGTPCVSNSSCEGGGCILGFCGDCKSVGSSCDDGGECCTGVCIDAGLFSTCV